MLKKLPKFQDRLALWIPIRTMTFPPRNSPSNRKGYFRPTLPLSISHKYYNALKDLHTNSFC